VCVCVCVKLLATARIELGNAASVPVAAKVLLEAYNAQLANATADLDNVTSALKRELAAARDEYVGAMLASTYSTEEELLRNASRTINETLQTLEQTHKERRLNQTLQQETAGGCECVCDVRPDYTIGVMPVASGGPRR
jgi:hypothetical protein